MTTLTTRKLGGQITREAHFVPGSVDEATRSVTVCWTTGAKGLRVPWFDDPYFEELSVNEKSVRLARLNHGAPLLDTHSRESLDQQLGVSERAWLEDGKGFATVRFRSNDRSLEVFRDVANGTIRNVSVGYVVHEYIENKRDGDEFVTRTATDWEPMEISFVPVGFDKDAQSRLNEGSVPINIRKLTFREGMEMDVVSAVDSTNRQEVLELIELGEKFSQKDLAKSFIENGRSADDLRKAILEGMALKQAKTPIAQPSTSQQIGLSAREARGFSLVAAIRAQASGEWRGAEFEREVSDAAKKAFGRDTPGILIPMDVLKTRLLKTTGTSPDMSGGAFIEEELKPDAFIDILQNSLVIKRLGARMLENLRGNVAIPKLTGSATAHWVAEGVAPNESNQTTTQVTLTPRTVGSWVDISRKLILQSSLSIEQFVRQDIASAIAQKIDQTVIYGSGSGAEPTGLMNMADVHSVAISTAGGPVTYEKILELEAAIGAANANVGTLSYLTNSKVKHSLKKTLKSTGVAGYLWEDTLSDGDGIVNGYRCAISNMIRSNHSATEAPGTFSTMWMAAFDQIILGSWGLLDIQVNPFGPNSTAGTVRVRALMDTDIAVRHPESFGYIKHITTP